MLSNDPDKKCSYHNWTHVERVIESATLLTSGLDFDEDHEEDILIAAIWHDADFAKGQEGHEVRSAELAKKSLANENLSIERIERVARLVQATIMMRDPESLDEEIMRDADLGHLAADDYMVFYRGLYNEIPFYTGKELSEEQWREDCISFMTNMKYCSERGRFLFDEGKEINLNKLKNMEQKHDTGTVMTEKTPEELLRLKEEKKRLKAERKKNEPKYNAEKGIETMFRLSLKNHITLSRIADDKANTLISVNAIILSIVLSALFPKLDSNPWLLYAGLSLILVSIATIIMATLSTIPKTTHGNVSKEDVKKKRGNLLFFGNFHKMSLADYEWGIGELMKDGEYLYSSLTRDLYFLGKVLNRKYSLLRYAYFVFVIGLVVSIFLFVWSVATLAPELVVPEIPIE